MTDVRMIDTIAKQKRGDSSMLSDPFGEPLSKPRTVVSAELAADVRRNRQRILRRAKDSERDFAKWLVQHDGPDTTHPKSMTTSTGRIGHVTGIQADVLSRTYLGENKHEIVPVKWLRYWQKINEKATEWGKDAVMRFDPSNTLGKKIPEWHLITPARHAELLRKEREYDNVANLCARSPQCVR